MKRHEELQPLSRQHHNGLLAALLINKGIKKNVAASRIQNFIIYCWEDELKEHFSLEESILLPALEKTAFNHSLTQQLLTEHKEIREIVDKAISDQLSIEDISLFAYKLEKHIRFEERSYFPQAEKALSENQLKDIGTSLHEDISRNCINYSDKFWE